MPSSLPQGLKRSPGPPRECSGLPWPAGRLWPLTVLALLVLTSCRDGTGRGKFSHWFVRRSPQQEMLRALEASDPDVRRQAVAKVAKSDQVSSDWALQGLDAIARTDPDSHARCAAIAGLQRSGRSQAVDTLLQILHADQHPERVAPPDAAVRAAAVHALGRLCAAGCADDQQRPAAGETLASLLTSDPNRHVRLAAAEGLSGFRDRQVLPVLVGSLRDRDFGVAYASRRSLVTLTGMEFGYDVSAWQQWLQQTAEPFAKARPKPVKPRPWWKFW